MQKNFLTFDIEEWHHANYGYLDFAYRHSANLDLEDAVDKIIDICEKYSVKSTCFIVGSIAKSKPHIVRKLFHAGHEIASHGFSHKMATLMSPKEFKEDAVASKAILEDIIGERIYGFRAPTWSVSKENMEWFYEILEECGFLYSSSVYPAHTHLFGIPDFPQNIHRPIVNGIQKNIIEIPAPITSLFGKKIGFSGGFFLRLFSINFILKKILQKNNIGVSVFLYVHPREIFPVRKRFYFFSRDRIVHYWGINSTEGKLEKIIEHFNGSFYRIKDVIS